MKKENVLLKYINDYLKDKDSDIYQEVRKQLEYNLRLNKLSEFYEYDIFETLDYHLDILKDYLKSFKEPLYLEKALQNDFSICPLCKELERSEKGYFYDYEDESFNTMCLGCKHYIQNERYDEDDYEVEKAYEEYQKAYIKYQNFLIERHRDLSKEK